MTTKKNRTSVQKSKHQPLALVDTELEWIQGGDRGDGIEGANHNQTILCRRLSKRRRR